MKQKSHLLNFSSKYFIIFLFVVIGFILYANTFQNKMFWDDDDNILKNQFIQNWQYFPKYFSENLIAGAGLLSNYWRPVLLFVFSLEWHLFEDWPLPYHFVNISFHIANAILLFFVLHYIFKSYLLAILTALVFLIHPLQTEVVTYISGLADPLSVFFIFIGILFYFKFRTSKDFFYKNKFYYFSLASYIFALMSKETAVIMPALIFIADFFSQDNPLFVKDRLKNIGKIIWPFFIIAGVYLLARATFLNFQNTFNLYNEENILTSNFHVRLFTFFRVLTIYFGILFWPFKLHMERSVEIAASLLSPSVIFGGLIFVGLFVLAFSQFKRFPILSFGILWFFIGLALTSGLVIPINALLYEHWLYLPMIGIFLIIFWLGIEAARKYNIQKILGILLVIFLIFLSILTIDRNKDWRDPITFYNQTLKYAPNSYRVINNLGMAYANDGNYKQAKQTYQRAISLVPLNPVAYHNLANTFKETGNIDLAIENYHKAIELDPKFLFSYNALASIYLENDNYQEARKVLESYLDNSDSKIDTFFLLTQVAIKEKDFKGALSYLEEALKIDPLNQSIQFYIASVKDLIESR